MRRLHFFRQHLAENKWAVLVFTLAAMVASLWLISEQQDTGNDEVLTQVFGSIVYGICMCGIALTAVTLLPKTIRSEIRMIAYVLAILLPSVDAIWFCFMDMESAWRSGSTFYYHILPWMCLLLVMPALPYLREKDDQKMHIFGVRWALLTMLASWVVGVVFALMESLLYGTFELFSFRVNWLFSLVGIWSAWLGVIATLGVMPDTEHPGEAQWAIKLGRRVFLPIFLIYLAVLLVYLVKIVIEWELPNGTVTYMVSAMMIQLVGVWMLIYPSLRQPVLKWEKWMRFLPLVCLPLVVLMSIGLYRRFSDYGITISRVYAVALNVWFYMLIVVLTLRTGKGKPLSAILLSLGTGLVLLSSIPYISVRDCTHRRLVREIDELMTDSQSGEVMQFATKSELENWLPTLPEEQGEALESKWNYLLREYGNTDIARWMNDVSDKDEPWVVYAYYIDYHIVTHVERHTLFDFDKGGSRGYAVPAGEWSEVYDQVWFSNSKVIVNPENPDELIIPFEYHSYNGEANANDTIRLNWHEKAKGEALFIPTYTGNMVSFRKLSVGQESNHAYFIVGDAVVFVK